MDDAADSSTTTPGRVQLALSALAGVVLWLNWFIPPGPPATDLDASWMAVLSEAFLNGWQFGKDVIFTFGPLGWLTSFNVQPGSLTDRLLWEFIGKGAMVASLIGFGFTIPARQRWFLYAGLLLFGGLFLDTIPVIVIVLSILAWVFPRGARPWLCALTIVGLAVFAQIKFTYSLLILAGVLLAAVSCVATRRWKRAALIVSGFCVAYLLTWMAAGQEIAGVPKYWKYSLEVARGYGSAMGFDETTPVLLAGLATLGACAAFLIASLRREGNRPFVWPATLFVGAAIALAWKHGFTRADGHVVGFFSFVLLLALAVPPLFGKERGWCRFEFTSILCFLGIWISDPWLGRSVITLADHRVRSGFTAVAATPTSRARFDAAMQQAASTLDQQALKEKVGSASIDMIGYQQGELLLGGFTYAPRPVFQSYSAYTPLLATRNLNYFTSAQAPAFVIAKIQTIDGRHPMSDDGLVLAELVRRYDAVDETSEHLLMKLKETPPATQDLALVERSVANVALGETVSLPDADGFAHWLQVIGFPTFVGKLRGALLRPPVLHMIVTETSGRETIHRLVLPTAELGFVVDPLIENVADYAQFARGYRTKTVRSIRFEPAHPDEAEFWAGAGIRICSMPEFPAASLDPEAMIFAGGVANRTPDRVHSEVTKMILKDGPRSEYLVHAPGEMVFTVPGARTLSGSFRITEGAYTGDGVTDGADFVVQARRSDGTTAELWRRRLSPLDRAEDRGRQSFSIDLPGDVNSVILLTLPGPSTNTDWDWTAWSELKFLDAP